MDEVRKWAQARQSFLRNDWTLKNLINALPDYFKQTNSTATLPSEVQDLPEPTAEEATRKVLWTKTPHLMLGTLEQYWHILEWIPEREARKHKYGEYEPFSDEGIERYKQLTSQQGTCSAQKASSCNPTNYSHTTNAVESTR